MGHEGSFLVFRVFRGLFYDEGAFHDSPVAGEGAEVGVVAGGGGSGER